MLRPNGERQRRKAAIHFAGWEPQIPCSIARCIATIVAFYYGFAFEFPNHIADLLSILTTMMGFREVGLKGSARKLFPMLGEEPSRYPYLAFVVFVGFGFCYE